VDAHRFLQRWIQIVDEYRQTGDMVHVRMSDDDVSDFVALLVVERDRDAAGVNRHAIVDQKTSQTLVQSGNTLVIKRTG
jgi:hypothetical protein